jgi:hypothetical protein
MKTKLLMLALAGVIMLPGTFHAGAASKASPTPEAPEPTPGPRTLRPLPFNGKIFTVDSVAKTFSTQNKEKKIRTYEITPETKLTKKNSAAAFEDLKPGAEVRGMATPKGDGQFETESVIIGARDEPKALPASTPLPLSTPRPIPKSKSTPRISPAKKPKAVTPAPSTLAPPD